MKTLVKTNIEKVALLAVMFFSSVYAFAQDAAKTIDVNTTKTTTTTTEEWYTNPLYWVIGAVLLIALVAVASRGRSRD